jgi:hypothetical protein
MPWDADDGMIPCTVVIDGSRINKQKRDGELP